MVGEDNLLTSRMREYKKLIKLKREKEWIYKMGMRFIVLSYIGSVKKRKQYYESGRLFFELIVGCSKSVDALLATFFGGFPRCEVRELAFSEVRRYIESEDGVFVKEKKYKQNIDSINKKLGI